MVDPRADMEAVNLSFSFRPGDGGTGFFDPELPSSLLRQAE